MTTPDEPDEGRKPVGAVVFREQPRSYLEVLVIVVLLAIGFVLDVGFNGSGAVTHLPGWIGALVLVAGIDAIFVAAARSTRLLVVTTNEVWVGDEMFVRADILGISPPESRDMPVLGWPSGKPGRIRGVAVHLAGDRDVLVPARRPNRLAAALGGQVGAPAPRAERPVRVATDADLDLLAEIDERAEIVFGLSGVELPDIEWQLPDDAIATFVVGDPPVAFVVLTEVDGAAHVEEIAVLPSAMRTGLGTRLLEHAAQWAREQGYDALTLITFADVQWNAPWYRERGFVDVAELSTGLVTLREREQNLGLDDAGARIVMRRVLGS